MLKNGITWLLIIAGLAACTGRNNNNNQVTENNNNQPIEKERIPTTAAQRQQESFFEAYGMLKDALFATDTLKASMAAQAIDNQLEELPANPKDDTAGWSAAKAQMNLSVEKVRKGNSIAEKRIAFSTLSDEYYRAIGKYGLFTKRAYRAYCPMAFHEKGAYWLSAEHEIKNPYFGNKMPDCGEVQDTLRF